MGQSLRYSPGWGNRHHCFVALCGGGLREETVPLPGFWRFAWHLPHFQSLHLLSICDWCPSSCCPGVESQSEWVCINFKTVQGPLNGLSWGTGSFFHLPDTHWFFQPEIMGLSILGAGTLHCAMWSGAGITHSLGIPPDFYPPCVSVGPHILQLPLLLPLCTIPHHLVPGSPTLPLLPVWINMASLHPWLLDLHTVRFSGSSECLLFGG